MADAFDRGVTVIMPAFDAVATVEGAIDSVRAQTYRDWELVVVDDGSRDGTHDAVRRAVGDDPRMTVLRHGTNRGAAAARNTALAAARGRRIAYLDADDLWLPEKMERQVAFMERTGAALSYCGFWRDAPGRRRRAVAVPPTVTREALLGGNVIGCLTACYDRAHLGDRPMPPLPLRQDYALWLDILRDVERAHGLTEPLAVHRVRRGSLSSGRIRATLATWRMYRRHVGLSPARSAACLASHLIRRVLR